MRYIYYIILIAAASAYPLTLLAMEKPPTALAGESPSEAALRKLHDEYEKIAKSGGWPSFKTSIKKIELGNADSRVRTIREILTQTGDYKGNSDSEIYDDEMAGAIIQFQLRHGLKADGVLGKDTQRELNVPVSARLRQIEATMRRVEDLKPPENRFLIVNIPEFMLRGYENGKKILEMRVIVGDKKNHTPRFDNAISYVSFNPHWGVPVRIAAEELLPKIIEDPNYITDNDYAIYIQTPQGRQEVDPATIDWAALDKENFHYLLRQRPGKGNALGKIKFGLTNSDGIYLHSTSAPQLFEKEYRALSHGCIRVERPRELMHFIFKNMENYDAAKLDERYDGDESKILKVTPLPVHIVYWTAWVDENGQANFRDDVYGLDS